MRGRSRLGVGIGVRVPGECPKEKNGREITNAPAQENNEQNTEKK